MASTARAESIVADALCRLETHEAAQGARKRKRKPNDRRRFVLAVAAVVLDAMHRHSTAPGGRIAVSLSNDRLKGASRYKAAAINSALPRILERLSSDELQLLTLEKGGRSPRRGARLSTFAAGSALVSMMELRGVGGNELADAGAAEVIELRAPRTNPRAQPKSLDYEDTDQVKAWRSQMRAINAWLASAKIAFTGIDQNGQLVDTSRRTLTRIFSNGRFDQGGRLYHGFWQDLSKERRRHGLTIEDEAVAELDFGQCGVRILYGIAGLQPPADGYAVPGYESRREGFKKLFNALLMAGVDSLNRYPQGTRDLFAGSGLKVGEAKSLLLQHHEGIRRLLSPEAGYGVTFRESEILIDALLQLRGRGIVALPIHDAIVVKTSKAKEALDVMMQVFREHTGVEGLVKVEGG